MKAGADVHMSTGTVPALALGQSRPPLLSGTPTTTRPYTPAGDVAGAAPARQTCRPHSVLVLPAQRPERGSSPGATRRVQGAQPMDG